MNARDATSRACFIQRKATPLLLVSIDPTVWLDVFMHVCSQKRCRIKPRTGTNSHPAGTTVTARPNCAASVLSNQGSRSPGQFPAMKWRGRCSTLRPATTQGGGAAHPFPRFTSNRHEVQQISRERCEDQPQYTDEYTILAAMGQVAHCVCCCFRPI